jgi:hypothetical protein
MHTSRVNDPNQVPANSLPFGEPEYREYPPATLKPRGPVYPSGPMPLGRPAQPVVSPYLYGPAQQAFQPVVSQPMPPFPIAKKKSRNWIFILGSIGAVIIILVAALIYAFSAASSSGPSTANIVTSSGTTSQPGVVNLGQSITVDGVTTTALSVEPLEGDGTINPASGNKYEVVGMRLQNNESTTQLYNPFDFHVFTGDNQERDVEIIVPDTYTGNQQLAEGNLDPNGSVRGDLIIQVPMNDHNVKLGWNPTGVASDSTYEWNLGL